MNERYLLREVSSLIKSYDKLNHIQGTNFNVFNVLGLTSNEVKTHSAFIAELLSPKGSHGMGSVFLSNFIRQFNFQGTYFKELEDFDVDSTIVYVEYHVGTKTEDKGGRIDILIEDVHKSKIIIENKIYAGDQENQMKRYHNFGKSTKSFLFYLTLFGSAPSKLSAGELVESEHYLCISYAREIKNWLEMCAKDAYRIPYLMNAILQYSELINDLTGNTKSVKMNNEIVNIIKNDRVSFAAAVAISQNVNNAKAIVLKNFGTLLTERLRYEIKDGTVMMEDSFGSRYNGIVIHSNKNPVPFILFSFLSHYNDCYIEIHPGYQEGTLLGKNMDLIEPYMKDLESMNRTDTRIMNASSGWQGEWICRYNSMNCKFEEMIEDPNPLLEMVVKDLLFVYDVFKSHTLTN